MLLKRQSSKVWTQWIFCILFALMFVGCSAKISQQQVDRSDESNLSDCRVIEHQLGEVCVPNHPQRVITLAPLLMFHALEMGVKPIGCSVYWPQDISERFLIHPLYLSLGSRGESISQVGMTTQPNLETILNLQPDLILAYDLAPTIESYSSLSYIAPTVLIPINGLTDWKSNFDYIAEVLNRKEEAQLAWNNYYQKIDQLKLDLNNSYFDKTISVAEGGIDGFYAFTANSGIGSILSDIGFQRPASQSLMTNNDRFSVSSERIEDIDGDLLFFMLNDSEPETSNMQRFPLWNNLNAVRDENIYFVNENWSGTNLISANLVIDDIYKYLVRGEK